MEQAFSLITLLVAFGASCALSLVTNWCVRGLAQRIGLVDRPDGHRKLQSRAVPLAGGISIFAATTATIGGLIVLVPNWRMTVFLHGPEALGLLAAGILIVVIGILDDWVGLRGRQKLFGQTLAATIVVTFGVCIRRVDVLHWGFDLGMFAVPFTVFWLVGAMNALNLLDGIDGLVALLGIILSAAVAVMASIGGHGSIALIAAVLAGAQLGFLRYNLPPASMYLGDAGSMLIGLSLGALAIQASLKGPGTVLLSVSLALWTIPIFDTAAAILRRKLTGRSIYTTDRAHLHHHLVDRLGHKWALLCLGAASLVSSMAALLSVWSKNDLIALLCGGFVVLIFISLRLFGHSEMLLALLKLRELFRSFLLPGRRRDAKDWGEAVHLQGTRQWRLLWETLTECAVKLDFVQLRLDVNVPFLGEGYHASWSRAGQSDGARHWKLDLPLMCNNRVAGSVMVVGERNDGVASENLEPLMEVLEELETHLQSLASPGHNHPPRIETALDSDSASEDGYLSEHEMPVGETS